MDLNGGGEILSDSDPQSTRAAGRAAPRLLLVDDDPEFLLEMKTRFAELGREISVAQTPIQAIWMLERQPLDAVVCDLRLGGADGRHLLEVVRDRWPRIARVLITGFGDEVIQHETWPAAQAVVFKPCDVERLATLLSQLPTNSGVKTSDS